jgi:hypothetical protein
MVTNDWLISPARALDSRQAKTGNQELGRVAGADPNLLTGQNIAPKLACQQESSCRD